MQLSGHVIVCGVSDVGLRVVEQLQRAGEQVVVVEDATDNRRVRLVKRWGVPFVSGDARRVETLEQCGLAEAAAVICAAANDLDDLAIALAVREAHPTVRLVVQLSNPAVGRAVAGIVGPGGVLDVARLAAPSFVEACLDVREHELSMEGVPFVVADLVAPRDGTLRELYGDLMPVAVTGARPETAICPGRDLAVRAGEHVTVIASREQVGPSPERPRSNKPVERARITTVWQVARGFLGGFERPIRVTLSALGVVAVISIVLLTTAYERKDGGGHLSLLDAAYFTVETLATVGFGDYSFANQTGWLKAWAIVLMFVGALLVTVTYALLTNYLVSRRIAESLGRRQVIGMRDHVVLVGLGIIGIRVLEALHAAARNVVIVERDPDNRFLGNARTLGVPIIIGDATLPQTLAAANVADARAVAVLTSNDLANIETSLVVEDLLGARRAEVPLVMRVFDRQLARAIETAFGFRYVRSTSSLAAPWFVGAALGLDVLNTFYVEQVPFLVGRFTVSEKGALPGRAMTDIGARVRMLAVVRAASGQFEYPLRRADTLAAGDVAYLVGPYEELLVVLGQQR